MSGSEQVSSGDAETAAVPDYKEEMITKNKLLQKNSGRRPFPTSCASGIAVIGITLFTLGLILCEAKEVQSPAILSGCLFFASGLVELITGIWAIVDNNLFGSTFMLCYGGLFLSLGVIVSDAFGTEAAYSSSDEYNNASGFYLTAWTVFTFFLWSSTFKSTLAIFALMGLLFLFLLLYPIATFTGSKGVKVASGVVCFITGCGCFYGVYDGLNTAANAFVRTPDDWLKMSASRHQPEDDSLIEIV
ncbi:hypothetical protein FOA43_003769 [Brettanomyces nanus]|uniref:GPR1/FUN34/yaaH family protein n=1 Tax=Eeniella nana TaxID=13502 RepID=A0A875RQA9_EENNA|nr:uncharacterized protein FOA43_003769 [Brettanomyces nanus]QPG76380.1 hypothetical protein FOA43_003769 [Brettanomyces nanus]